MPQELDLIGLTITNVTVDRALEMIDQASGGKFVMHFVNAHCINVAAKDHDYHRILQTAAARFPDGSGIRLAGKMLNVPIVENVNGTDLFPHICKLFAQREKRMYLLGAAPSVAEKSAAWANTHAEKDIVAGYHQGFFDSEDDERAVVAEINASGADLLLVAMGVPMQEKWIDRYRESLDVPLCMGVGGLFDFYSGSIRRAPRWMRSLGIEWVWRLLMEPRRMWQRYIVGNWIFVLRLLRIWMERRRRG